MKQLFHYIIMTIALFSCNDSYLERYPLDEIVLENYFQNAQELETYTNSFYADLPSATGIFYNTPHQGDDEARSTLADEFRGTRTTPTTGGNWEWEELRNINLYLQYSHQCDDEDARLLHDGIARFFRALFYFSKLYRFGDVPWYDTVLGVDDEGLTKARDSRKLVVDKMLEDLDFAIEYGRTEKSGQLITKWTALALKSRICLFEGTFRKYHDLGDWEIILQECVDASKELMDAQVYTIYTSTPDLAYHELFVATDAILDEIILARQYGSASLYHSYNFYILSASYGSPGMQKSLVDSYLMNDGSRFTDIDGYETMQFYEETQNRDPRMAQTIRTPGYKRIGSSSVSVPDFGVCVTGYQYSKYLLSSSYDTSNKNINDMPIFRYAEVLLNFAEAKAELGTLTQEDIDQSVKLLRDRVGMPNMNMSEANATPCPYLLSEYPNVSKETNTGVILEIRRERRIELVKEGHRYRDLLRWKEGKRLEKPFYGMYFPGVGEYDLDRDGTIDLVIYDGEAPSSVSGRQYQKLGELSLENGENGGRIVNLPDIDKSWDEDKDYLYPIPLNDLLLNPNLIQNPGWDTVGE